MSTVDICEVGGRRYRVRTALSGGGSDASIDLRSKSHNARNTAADTGKSLRQDIPVPRQLHKYLVGNQSATLLRLRQESQAKITIPNERSKSDTVQIEGLPEELAKAEELILQIIKENLHRIPYTHFISLPISDIDVQRKVKLFQADVAREFLRDVDCRTFTDPESLHITIGMLRLLTPKEIAGAVELLKSLQKQISDELSARPLVIKVGQPKCMEPNVKMARVIHAQAGDFADDGRLRRLCEFVRAAFDQAGYIDDKRALKIHITVLKAKEATECAENAGCAGKRACGTINAAPLLKKFGGADFGICRVGQIQIAKRFQHTDAGAYDNEGFVLLP
ncbi:activating signal cointegrator 1 complex subunit [Kickxella alabastrina]|uniref:Activating signal cointegrator 1 complex subunit n=1 Tax=Kickxella alabastrina TaxID=61397 RepID=A0ACC1I438_9FUNG|nr:activating signal cointegrator 1 complex subunit [Kickxella alabastrina]